MDRHLAEKIRSLLNSQRLAVLATSADGHPYTTLIAFTETADLRQVLFATHRNTRKAANLQTDQRVTLLLDNRANQPEDFRQAAALTITGTAEVIPDAERPQQAEIYLAKHPYLCDFITTPGCLLYRVKIQRYSLVQRFQDVMEVILDEALPAP